jgi:hypothetical protein
MSAQHCSVKNGASGKGGAHANYVSGLDKYAGREDVISVIEGNLPAWAKSGVEFFSAADQNERANGRPYREIEFSIPREVADPVKYAEQFAEKLLGKDYPFLMGVHSKTAADGKPNTHCHLMFSERKLDGIERTEELFFKRANSKNPEKGGTAKDRNMNSKEFVKSVRALHQSHAAENGVSLDMRNWKERGADRPEPKIGPVHARTGELKIQSMKMEIVAAIREERVQDERKFEAGIGRVSEFSQAASRARRSLGRTVRAANTANQFIVDDLNGIEEIERGGDQASQGKASPARAARASGRLASISDLPGMLECSSLLNVNRPNVYMPSIALDIIRQEQEQKRDFDLQQERVLAQAKAQAQEAARTAQQAAQERAAAQAKADAFEFKTDEEVSRMGMAKFKYKADEAKAIRAGAIKPNQTPTAVLLDEQPQEKIMATQEQRELAAAATAHKNENPTYTPSLEVLRAVDAVLIENEQQKPSKSTLAAFLKGDRYTGPDGKEYSLHGLAEPGKPLVGRIVGHIDLQEGKFSLVHIGRGVVQVAAGILAAIGGLIDQIAQGRGEKGKGGIAD